MKFTKLLVWTNYIKWIKDIFSSPKYYLGVFIWIPVFLANLYVSIVCLAILTYTIIAWAFFSLLGDPGFSVSSVSYSTKQTEPPVAIDSTGKTFVACCISGGGSRSAVFSGEILHLLSNLKEINDPEEVFQSKNKENINILDTLDFISSVSGGSVAATSLCIDRPWEQQSPDAWDKYKKKLRIKYQHKLYQYLANPIHLGETALTHRDRTNIMQKVWDHYLVSNKKLGDLPLRPRLLVNATLFNTARRFVFTTLPKSSFDNMLELYPSLFANLEPFPAETATLDEFYLSNVNCPLSTAVAASTAFPVGLPPVTINGYTGAEKDATTSLLHLSDGGIYDNHGIETVVQLFRQSINNYYQGKEMRLYGGIVLVIDASLPVEEKFALASPNEFDMIMHTIEVYEKRMQMYFDRFLQEQVILSNKINVPLRFVRFSISELLGMLSLSSKTKEEREETLKFLQDNLRNNIHVGSQKHARIFIEEWFQKPDSWWKNFKETSEEIVKGDVVVFMNQLQNIPTNFALEKKEIQTLETASRLIFKLKEKEIKQTYDSIREHVKNYKSLEDMKNEDIEKEPFLYVFETMRQIKLGNKRWRKNRRFLRTAIDGLSIPQEEKKEMSTILDNIEIDGSTENINKFEDFYQKTFKYIQEEDSNK